MFYTDVPAGISVLRLFKPRQAIDLAFVEEGHLPSDNNGIFIDKLFAKSHFLAVGDTLTVGDRTMKVTGIGCLPDYCYIKENTSDVAANDEFSVAIVSDSAWESLKTGCRVIYNYAYRLPEDLSPKVFKNKIIHLKADYSAITDTYLKGQYETSSSIKEGFTGSADSLRHSVSVLSEGVKSMHPVLPEDAYQALFFGINVSLLLIMFSVACYYSIMGHINGITSDIGYNYMYVLRNPVTDLPKDADLGFVRGFYTDYDLTGGEMEVSLLGIDSDNPYFPFSGELSDNESEIYMSDSARVKFGFKTGDKVILRDASEDRLYSFVIAGEVKYSSGLYFFMNIDAMRKAFSLSHFDPENLDPGEKKPKSENFYYNAVFSNEKLTFRHNMMMSEISKEDMQKGAEKFISLMSGMIVLMIAISLVIFIAVMYLLMKLEIDRSSYSISLLKALGYSEREVNSFYLGSSLYMTLASIVIGMPAGRLIVGAAYPFCVSNVNAGFEAYITSEGYVFIIAIILLTYALTWFMLERYLKKISLSEILKNRE